MADRTTASDRISGTEVQADGAVARGISGWTWATVAILAAIVLIGALLIGGFFNLGQRGMKINSENRTAERPAEP